MSKSISRKQLKIELEKVWAEESSKFFNGNNTTVRLNEIIPNYKSIRKFLETNNIPFETFLPKGPPPNKFDISFGEGIDFRDLQIVTQILKLFGLKSVFFNDGALGNIYIGSYTDEEFNTALNQRIDDLPLNIPFHLDCFETQGISVDDLLSLDWNIKLRELLEIHMDYPIGVSFSKPDTYYIKKRNEIQFEKLKNKLFPALDELKSNTKLTSREFSIPLLGIIYLRLLDNDYMKAESEIEKSLPVDSNRSVTFFTKNDFFDKKAIFLPKKSRWDAIVVLQDTSNIGECLNKAFLNIEREYKELLNIYPKRFDRYEDDLLKAIIRIFNDEVLDNIPFDVMLKIIGESFIKYDAHRLLIKYFRKYTLFLLNKNVKSVTIKDKKPYVKKEIIDSPVSIDDYYDEQTFYALTDGQYGDYDDWKEAGGDIDSLRDGLGH